MPVKPFVAVSVKVIGRALIKTHGPSFLQIGNIRPSSMSRGHSPEANIRLYATRNMSTLASPPLRSSFRVTPLGPGAVPPCLSNVLFISSFVTGTSRPSYTAGSIQACGIKTSVSQSVVIHFRLSTCSPFTPSLGPLHPRQHDDACTHVSYFTMTHIHTRRFYGTLVLTHTI